MPDTFRPQDGSIGAAPAAVAQPAAALRIGVVGCANIAERRMLPAMAQQPLAKLVAVASRSPEKAASFAGRFGCAAVTGYERLLDRPDIDAVYVPLPAELHHEWVLRALRAGKHVLCEKPLAITRADAVEAATLAGERGLLLMESFMFLHHTQHAAVQRLLAEGTIGELRSFSSEFGFQIRDPGPHRHRADTASALHEVGVYPLRAAQLFLGDRLEVLGADLHMTPDVAGSALLRAADGVTALITFGLRHAYRCEYTLWGSEGQISLRRAYTTPDTLAPVVRVARHDLVEERTLPPDRQFVNITGAFARAALTGEGFETYADEVVRQAGLMDELRARAAR
jgi:NDP-hexose-3-ketoreductase